MGLVFVVAAAAAAIAVPSSEAPECRFAGTQGEWTEPALRERNAAVARRFWDALDAQDFATLDKLVAPGYRHNVTSGDGFKQLSWDDFKRGYRHARSAFPDWDNRIDRLVADTTTVAVLVRGSGTHSGSLMGEKPTGRKIQLPYVMIHAICDGRITADWEIMDVEQLKALIGPSKP